MGAQPDGLRREAAAQAEVLINDETVIGEVLQAEDPVQAVGVDQDDVSGARLDLYAVDDHQSPALGKPEQLQIFMPIRQDAIAWEQAVLVEKRGEHGVPYRIVLVFIWAVQQRRFLLQRKLFTVDRLRPQVLSPTRAAADQFPHYILFSMYMQREMASPLCCGETGGSLQRGSAPKAGDVSVWEAGYR